jgi:hypothetical protein
MRSSDRDILDRWLNAERLDQADEAEAALQALFATLPPLGPPAGFADRVLLRASFEVKAEMMPVAARRTLFASLWVRALLVLSFLSISVSAIWLPQTVRAVAGLWSVAGMVRAWTGSVIEACRWLGSVLGLWELLVTIGRALATPLETPAVALAMVTCLLVSMVAFRFLRNLITRDRSWIHETV